MKLLWVVHGEVTFAVLDFSARGSRCCLSFAIQHLGPPTETHEVVASPMRDEEKFFTDRIVTIRILGTMYSRSWAHNLSAQMRLEVRGACNEPL